MSWLPKKIGGKATGGLNLNPPTERPAAPKGQGYRIPPPPPEPPKGRLIREDGRHIKVTREGMRCGCAACERYEQSMTVRERAAIFDTSKVGSAQFSDGSMETLMDWKPKGVLKRIVNAWAALTGKAPIDQGDEW